MVGETGSQQGLITTTKGSALARQFGGSLLVAAIALYGTGASAAEWYRYIDDAGEVVLDQSIPPRFVPRGYTVLGDDGQVLRKVAALPTSAERAQLKAAAAARAALEDSEARAMAADEELLRKYTSVSDVDRARDRRIESISAAIKVNQANIIRLRNQRGDAEQHAVDMERSGREISSEMLDNLRVIEQQIAESTKEVAQRQAEIEEARETFAAEAERLRELFSLR